MSKKDYTSESRPFADSGPSVSLPLGRAPFLRTPYNYSVETVSNETGLVCEDPSRTVQDGKEDADINVIMERFARTGQFKPPANLPQYGDFTSVTDFQSALNMVLAAEDGFMQLPAGIRSRFHNDPAALLAYLDDDANREEAIKLGILAKPAEVPPLVKQFVDKDTGEISTVPNKPEKG